MSATSGEPVDWFPASRGKPPNPSLQQTAAARRVSPSSLTHSAAAAAERSRSAATAVATALTSRGSGGWRSPQRGVDRDGGPREVCDPPAQRVARAAEGPRPRLGLGVERGRRRWRLNQELSSPGLSGAAELALEQTRRPVYHPGDTPAQG